MVQLYSKLNEPYTNSVQLFASLLFALSIGSIEVDEVQNPRQLDSWVSDQAKVIDEETEQEINKRVESLYQETGAELAIVTLDSITITPKDFATRLFNRWGVGDREANNGVLMLLVMDSRRIEVEVGYGLEHILTDSKVGRLLEIYAVPKFKQGDFSRGIELLVEHSVTEIQQNPIAITPKAKMPKRSSGGPGRTLLIFFSCLGLGIFGLVRLAIWRKRKCPNCIRMLRDVPANEISDYLSDGQKVERKSGSIVHRILRCRKDGFIRIVESEKNPGFRSCRECKNRTAKEEARLHVEGAEQGFQQLLEVRVTCLFCEHSFSYRKNLRLHDPKPIGITTSSDKFVPYIFPPKTPSNSSSSDRGSRTDGGWGSSGGGSFGGGSSGGGGAGASW